MAGEKIGEDSQMEDIPVANAEPEERPSGSVTVTREYVAEVVTEQIRLLEIRLEAFTRDELSSFGQSVQNFLVDVKQFVATVMPHV